MEEPQTSKRSRVEGGGEGKREVSLLPPWQNPAARICRVSRASGGKDRHSKVLTAKGLRDRRVRLSVSTAIQFYDLQDRLGYDQPSKAVEWLIKAASAAIAELPSLDGAFMELSNRIVGAKRRGGFVEVEGLVADQHGGEGCHDHREQKQQHLSLTKSTCSSTSETSKGSVLSLSRSEGRVKTRERAKEGVEKKKVDGDDGSVGGSSHHQGHCSFTDLLTGGGCQGNNVVTIAQADSGAAVSVTPVFMQKQTVTADYFSQNGNGGQVPKHAHLLGLSAQTHLLNGSPIGVMPFNFTPAGAASGGDHGEIQQQFPFLQDHIVPVAAVASGGDYNLNFSISPGFAGFNRGTLQSNSPPIMAHFPNLQRFSSQTDGSNLPFFFGTAIPTVSASGESSFPSGIDGRLQIYYGDGYRHQDPKEKGKN